MNKEKLYTDLKIGFGGIVFSLEPQHPGMKFLLDSDRSRFLVDDKADVTLKAYFCQRLPELNRKREILNSRGLWNFYREKNKRIFAFKSDYYQPVDRVLDISPDLKSGKVYIRKGDTFKFQFPFDEVLMINLLTLNTGVLTHACAVKYKGQGFMFVGVSGAGKSTMANLWKRQKGVTILSDDRIIVRRIKDKFWIYGTPWHGDARLCSPERVALTQIFFIQHAKNNMIKKISPMDSLSRLMRCIFGTFWDKKGMSVTLKLCCDMVSSIPCFELGFVPDAKVIKFILSKR